MTVLAQAVDKAILQWCMAPMPFMGRCGKEESGPAGSPEPETARSTFRFVRSARRVGPVTGMLGSAVAADSLMGGALSRTCMRGQGHD